MIIQPTRKKWGGARAGAGRKPKPQITHLALRLSPAIIDLIKHVADSATIPERPRFLDRPDYDFAFQEALHYFLESGLKAVSLLSVPQLTSEADEITAAAIKKFSLSSKGNKKKFNLSTDKVIDDRLTLIADQLQVSRYMAVTIVIKIGLSNQIQAQNVNDKTWS